MNLQKKFTETRQALVEGLRIIGILQAHVHAADDLMKAIDAMPVWGCRHCDSIACEHWEAVVMKLTHYRALREPCEASKEDAREREANPS